MAVLFVDHFQSEVSAVENIRPSGDHFPSVVKKGLIEVESVEVHRRHSDTHGSTPNPYNWESSKKKVKRTAVIKRSILEDQAAEVPVSSHDVVSFLVLPELVTVVVAFVFSGFTHQRTGDE